MVHMCICTTVMVNDSDNRGFRRDIQPYKENQIYGLHFEYRHEKIAQVGKFRDRNLHNKKFLISGVSVKMLA